MIYSVFRVESDIKILRERKVEDYERYRAALSFWNHFYLINALFHSSIITKPTLWFCGCSNLSVQKSPVAHFDRHLSVPCSNLKSCFAFTPISENSVSADKYRRSTCLLIGNLQNCFPALATKIAQKKQKRLPCSHISLKMKHRF